MGEEEIVEFDTRGRMGWERRFYIRPSTFGRGLFAARDYAPNEYMTVYMGVDIGAEGTPEGMAARARLQEVRRADHIMLVAKRYVDGRHAVSGAQYINTNTGQRGRKNNASFSATTGSIKVDATAGVRTGEEILMPYGSRYWQARRHEARREERDTRRGGAVAYSLCRGGSVVFVEELMVARDVRGHGLHMGRRLMARMLAEVGAQAHEIHLIVRRDNTHARALYTELQFQESAWQLHEPFSHELYMVADTAAMAMAVVRDPDEHM